MSEKFYNTIVLMDHEKNTKILKYLGTRSSMKYGVPEPMMCAMRWYEHKEKLYSFECFNLFFCNDELVSKNIATKDGIIIVIENINQNIEIYIDDVINNNNNKSILILFAAGELASSNGNQVSLPDNIKLLKELSKKYSNEKVIISIAQEKLNKEYQDTHKHQQFKHLEFININSSANSPTELFMRRLKMNEINEFEINSINCSDKSFVKAFNDTELPIRFWDHYGRLRIVFLSLKMFGYDETIKKESWLCTKWIKYKTRIGHEHLWNYTLTRFWLEILQELKIKHKYENFEDLYKNHKDIHFGSYFKKFYTNEILFSDQARSEWIPPAKTQNKITQYIH